MARASLLVDAHMAGYINVIGDIPSFSFGYSKQSHCTSNSEFLSLINPQLPLPHQRSWKGFCLSFELITKFISELGENASPMVDCKQLRRTAYIFGCSGVPIAEPLELTHTWRKSIVKPKQGLQQDFQAACKKEATDVENRFKLEQSVQHLEVSTQRFTWT